MICGKCNSSMVYEEPITTEEGRITQRICKKCGQTGRYGWKNKEESMGVTNGEREARVELGKKIKAARGAIPFFQIKAKTGIAISTLSLIEHGKCPCTDERAEEILAAIAELKEMPEQKEPAFTEAPPENNGLREYERSASFFFEDEKGRKAVITFINGKFGTCSYNTLNKSYSAGDWKFMGQVAAKLKELEGELCGSKR